jgi:hypothetical protein
MDLQPIVLPLAAGALAGASLTKKPLPTTQAQLDALKGAAAKGGGTLMIGTAMVGLGAGLLALYKPKAGAAVFALMGAGSLYSAMKAEPGSAMRVGALAGTAVAAGLAGTLVYGKPAAVKGAGMVAVGLGGASLASTAIFLSDISRMPGTIAELNAQNAPKA